MKNKKQKIWQVVHYIVFIPLILIIMLFVGATVPGIGNYQVLTVLSGSMEPTIKAGSTVVVMPRDTYKVGDIITFSTGGDIPTTHRIEDIRVEAGEIIYITKGDANPTEDITETKKEDIVGKAVFSIPYLGYIVEFIKTPVGFGILVGIPAILIIGGEIKKIYREIKKKNEKSE